MCAGTTTTLTGPAGMDSYQWSFVSNSSNSSFVTVTNQQSVTVRAGRTSGSFVLKLVTTLQGVSSVDNCTNSVEVSSVTVSLSGPPAVNCVGTSTTLTATATGTSKIYEYSFNGGAFGLANTIVGTAGMTYSVVARDAYGCLSDPATYTVPSRTVLLALNSPVITCYGGSATLVASASGGTGPYAYSLNGGSFGAANTFSVVANTPYTVVARDVNLCQSASASFTLSGPAQLLLTLNNPAIACYGGTAALTATPAGGTAPYSYLWSPGGQTGAGITAGAGTFSVLVTDANGCTASATRALTQPTPVLLALACPPIACSGGSATLTATASGGTAPYTYALDGGAFGTASTFSVGAGSHSVVARDLNGCLSPAGTRLVTGAGTLAVSLNNPAIACYGGTAALTATPAGGTAPYSYLWSPGGQTGAGITAGAGTFSVLVTDANGCTASATRALTQPTPLTVLATSTNTGCTGATGTATAMATGGTSPYTYLWSPGGQTAATAVNLTAGSYTVAVLDANNCRSLASVAVGRATCPVQQQHCTLTQGGYGNSNGSFCGGPRRTALITSLLATGGNMVIGAGTRTITYASAAAAQQAACIINNLPAGGTAAALPSNTAADGCAIPATLLHNGRFNNVLIGQTITLSLNLRLDGSLGGVLLAPTMTSYNTLGACSQVADPADLQGLSRTIPSSVLTNLGSGATVQSLLALANKALGGVSYTANGSTPGIADINAAVSAINELYDNCRVAGPQVVARGAAASSVLTLVALPNPANDLTSIEFRLALAGPATLTVYSALGAKVATLFDGTAAADRLYQFSLKTSDLAIGVYFYRLTTPEGMQTNRLMLVR